MSPTIGRFGIRHCADGTWWAGGNYYSSAWTLDERQARRFMCRDDALFAAYTECTANPDDYLADRLPARCVLVGRITASVESRVSLPDLHTRRRTLEDGCDSQG